MENFDRPQRQSAIGIVVLFFDTVQEYGRALWPILVLMLLRFNTLHKAWFAMGALAVFAVIGVIAYLKFRNFTFFLDHQLGEFVVTEGVISKTRITVPLYKIQQVNIKQSLLQRIIGVHALEVDTAGSKDQEVVIKAIPHAIALLLKERLLASASSANTDVPDTEQPSATIISIGLLSLFKMGITSNYLRTLGLMLAFFFTVYDNFLRFSNHGYISEDEFSGYIERGLAMQSIGFLILLLLMAMLVVNVVRIVVRYFDYSVARQQGSLLLSFGLLNTKSTILKPEKVQILAITQNFFQKKLDILELRVRQATGGEHEQRKQAIEIPGCNRLEADAIVRLLLGRLPEKGAVLTPNFRKLVFAIFLTIVLPLGVLLGVATGTDESFGAWGWAIGLYVVSMATVQYFDWRHYRLFVHDDFIIKRSGAWDIRDEIIEPRKIQALSVSQLFWHKSADIGYLTIHTAGGDLRFQLGDYTRIKQYVNLWLYRMERSDSDWM